MSPGSPLGDAPVPMLPGDVVFGTPGWLIPGLLRVDPVVVPVRPVPVAVVLEPPGAAPMPAVPGLCAPVVGSTATPDEPGVVVCA